MTLAMARSDGIYVREDHQHLRCSLCQKVLKSSPLAKAAHGKKHVREGTAVEQFSFDYSRTIYVAKKEGR